MKYLCYGEKNKIEKKYATHNLIFHTKFFFFLFVRIISCDNILKKLCKAVGSLCCFHFYKITQIFTVICKRINFSCTYICTGLTFYSFLLLFFFCCALQSNKKQIQKITLLLFVYGLYA